MESTGPPRRVEFKTLRKDEPLPPLNDPWLNFPPKIAVLERKYKTTKAMLEGMCGITEETPGITITADGELVVPPLPVLEEKKAADIDSVPELLTEPYKEMRTAVEEICKYYVPLKDPRAKRRRTANYQRGGLYEKCSPGVTVWKERLYAELTRHKKNGRRSSFRNKILRIIQDRFKYEHVAAVRHVMPGGRDYAKACQPEGDVGEESGDVGNESEPEDEE